MPHLRYNLRHPRRLRGGVATEEGTMQRNTLGRLARHAWMAALATGCAGAAEHFPARPIRAIVPFAPRSEEHNV